LKDILYFTKLFIPFGGLRRATKLLGKAFLVT